MEMNRQRVLFACVLIAASASLVLLGLQQDAVDRPPQAYLYAPSDITKANPNLVIAPTEMTYRTTDISETKDTVLLSVSGMVTGVGDPITWSHEGDVYGAVPVTIDIGRVAKDKESRYVSAADAHAESQTGAGALTFYVSGIYEHGQHYVLGFEPGFEIDEHVILHLGRSAYGPDGRGGDNYFVELGEFGKYRIVKGMAYNQKYPDGRSLDAAFDEAS